MELNESGSIAREIMLEFANSTGISFLGRPPRRYLWTDAFAVCNFLELFRLTHDTEYRDLALNLVDQVHHTLGRHRDDDLRRGWISGLDEREGALHPTRGGLRIGKQLNERRPGDPPNERLEWDRDGQYYHYMTKWMHALSRVSRVTGDPVYYRWALELAQTAHATFTYIHPGDGRKRMYWKMSIDLSYPLVLAMGQHDPLDGLVTYSELQAIASEDFSSRAWPGLSAGIAEMADICRGEKWATDDPLGIGSLLTDAWRMMQLVIMGGFNDPVLLEAVLDSALIGLHSFAGNNPLKYRARQRLAFRELGLAIGLKAVAKLHRCIEANPHLFAREGYVQKSVESLAGYLPLGEIIERFWLDDKNRQSGSWTEHREINMVMLATSLAPDGLLFI
jgi:hypothetical protein